MRLPPGQFGGTDSPKQERGPGRPKKNKSHNLVIRICLTQLLYKMLHIILLTTKPGPIAMMKSPPRVYTITGYGSIGNQKREEQGEAPTSRVFP